MTEHADGIHDVAKRLQSFYAAEPDLYGKRVLDSIDQLRRDLSDYHGQLKAYNDLQAHSERQRERIACLEGLYAKVKAENAKLKEQTIWMAQTDSRWEAAVRDRDQAKAENERLRSCLSDADENARQIMGEYGELEAENARLREMLEMEREDNESIRRLFDAVAPRCGKPDCPSLVEYVEKLRELVRDMWRTAMANMDFAERYAFAGEFNDRMRELGVEVGG